MVELLSFTELNMSGVINIVKPSKKEDVSERLQVAEFGKKFITQLEQQGSIGNSIIYSCS